MIGRLGAAVRSPPLHMPRPLPHETSHFALEGTYITPGRSSPALPQRLPSCASAPGWQYSYPRVFASHAACSQAAWSLAATFRSEQVGATERAVGHTDALPTATAHPRGHLCQPRRKWHWSDPPARLARCNSCDGPPWPPPTRLACCAASGFAAPACEHAACGAEPDNLQRSKQRSVPTLALQARSVMPRSRMHSQVCPAHANAGGERGRVKSDRQQGSGTAQRARGCIARRLQRRKLR